MRVTNEQAKEKASICVRIKQRTCYGCRYNDDKHDVCPSTYHSPELALDLLDARETIKKQGEIINEMREALNGFRAGNCFCECGIDNPMMNGRHTKNCIQANAILEKTKDYA